MNKKAIFFTYISLFLIILIVLFTTTRNKYRYSDKGNALSARVATMNNFIKDVEADLDREMFIGGYRALLGLQIYIREKKGFITDVDEAFTGIFSNATVNDTLIELMRQDDQGADLAGWAERVNDEANKINVDFSFIPNQIWLTQTDPWSVNIHLNCTILLSDSKGLASWNTTQLFIRRIPILGFEDPLYTVYTNDKITTLINITPTLDFVDSATNDTTNLQNHINMSYYVNSTNGPSFLMRFEGNLSASPMGIESMVNLDRFQRQSIAVRNKTLVDYIYFSDDTTSDYCDVQNMPEWFRLDQSHSELYEVDDLDKKGC